jgi:type IV pilus assembly protein PilE
MKHLLQRMSGRTHLRIARTERHGFSLIELLIVLTLMGILSALALPHYREYIQRSHRAHARAALLQAAQWMEQAATVQGSYPRSNTQDKAIPAGVLVVEGGRYTLSADSPNGESFTLRAQAQGPQASDPCATFELTHTGQRAQVATPNVPTPLTALECWNR